MHLEVLLEDGSKPRESKLRVWNGPEKRWELRDADEAQVLELLGEAGAERARSAGRKAIQAARDQARVEPAAAARASAPPAAAEGGEPGE